MLDLILAEMAEQETWSVSVPAWHPTGFADGDGDDAGDAGDGDKGGDGTDGDKGGDKGGDGDKLDDKAQAAVDSAYAKLREAEKERDTLAAKVRKAERSGMDELEKTKAELEDSRLEAAALQERLDAAEWEGDVLSLAKAMKFKKPEAAKRFVDKEHKTTADIKKALKAAVDDIPELITDGAPPPPVGGGNGGGNDSENARMNRNLRAAAGRGVVR